MLREDGGLGEILHAVVQGFGEGLDEGAAARGAGLVEQHAVHRVVFDLDAFHVLAADVQDAVHIGVEEGGGVVMGHGLHLAVVQEERGFHQGLAVACGAGAHDAHALRQLPVDFL